MRDNQFKIAGVFEDCILFTNGAKLSTYHEQD